MTHTSEPWTKVSFGILGPEGETLLIGMHRDDKGSLDLQRAVCCVNACKGLEDPAAELKRLRDALAQGIDALQSFVDDSRDPGTGALSALYMMKQAIGLQSTSSSGQQISFLIHSTTPPR